MGGIVTAVGPGAFKEDGNRLPMMLKEGDEVLLPNYGGQEFKIDDDEFVLLREPEVIAKLDIPSKGTLSRRRAGKGLANGRWKCNKDPRQMDGLKIMTLRTRK